MIIAIPIGHYVMNRWLQGFAYRININLRTYFVTVLIVLIITILSVSFQAIKAAMANPIESLKCE